MLKLLALLIAALCVLALAQDTKVLDTDVALPDGLNTDVVDMTDKAETEADEAVPKLMSEQEGKDIANFTVHVAIGIVKLVADADINKLKEYETEARANVTRDWVKFQEQRNQTIADLNLNITVWRAHIADLAAKRQDALNANTPFDQVKAAALFAVIKAEMRAVAIHIALLVQYNKVRELQFRRSAAFLLIVNNTIALKNGSNVGGADWTPLNHTDLALKFAELSAVTAINEVLAVRATVAVVALDIAIALKIAEIRTKIALLAYNIVAKIEQARAQLIQNVTAAAEEIRQRVRDWVDKVNSTVVDIRNAEGNGNITIAISVIRAEIAANIEAVKEDIRRGIRLVIAALLGADQRNVTVTVAEPQKRAAGLEYATLVSVGGSDADMAATSAAGSLVASVVAVAAAAMALVF